MMNIKVAEGTGQIQPSFEVTETPSAVKTTANFSVGSLSPGIVQGEWDAQNRAQDAIERAIDTAQRIIGTTREGIAITKSIKRENEFLTWLYQKGYIDKTNYELYTQLKTSGYHGLRFFIPRIVDRLVGDVFSPLGQRLRRFFGINQSQEEIRRGMIKTIDGMKFYSDKQLEAVIRASIPEVLRRGGEPAETIERAWELFLKDKVIAVNSQISSVLTVHDPNELLVSPVGDVKPGDKLTYTINYENEGEGDAYGVYVTDTLLDNLDDATLVVNNGGKYNPGTRTISWFIGELPSKQKGSVTFSVDVNKDAPDKAEVINFATVYFPSVPETTRTNGTVNTITTSIDNVAPTTAISAAPLANPAGWNNSDVTVNLSAKDNDGGTGVKEIHYTLSGAAADTKVIAGDVAQILISAEGKTTLTYYSIDNAGNSEPAKSLEIKIDKTPPIITSGVSVAANANGWNNTDVTVSFTATDSLSGVATVTDPTTVITEGKAQVIGGEAIDLAGNRATTSVALNIDKTPPAITAQLSPQPNVNGWNNTDVIVSFTSTDNLSGIASVTKPVTVTTEGKDQRIDGEAIDLAGNKAVAFATLNIDKTPPKVILQLKSIKHSESHREDGEDKDKKKKEKEDENKEEGNWYQLFYSAADSLSGLKAVKAGLTTISVSGYKTELEQGKEIEIKIDEKKKKIEIEAPNPQDILAQLKNGVLSINNNQVLQLKLKHGEAKWKIKQKEKGIEIQTPSIVFKAEAADYADNKAQEELEFKKK